jgi:tetratricopeptide (TPR) repeat protein
MHYVLTEELKTSTRREVADVQAADEAIFSFFLSRLSFKDEAGSEESRLIRYLGPRSNLDPRHQTIVLQALALHVFCFSGNSTYVRQPPLWLKLLHENRGLRGLSPDYVAQADHLLTTFQLPPSSVLAKGALKSAPVAFRLCQWDLAESLAKATPGSDSTAVLARIHSMKTGMTDLESAQAIASKQEPELRLSILASLLTQTLKKNQSVTDDLVRPLQTWIEEQKGGTAAQARPTFAAHLVNSLNLFYLQNLKIHKVHENLSFLEASVFPRLSNSDEREHIEGNYRYQQSILARIAGDVDKETEFLIQAIRMDRGFATPYYRLAQTLHDRADPDAITFYEKALALSPIDLATANDYGCCLSDLGREDLLESWSQLCMLQFPEQFTSEG